MGLNLDRHKDITVVFTSLCLSFCTYWNIGGYNRGRVRMRLFLAGAKKRTET